MVKENLILSKILTRQAFENAIKINAAIGGSTNAVIHLIALARRMGVPLELNDFDRLGHDLPCLVNLQPSGKYLMEDFYYAGGLPAVIRELGSIIWKDALTVNGKTIGENTQSAENYNSDVIRSTSSPYKEKSGIAVLRGNLCPRGAVIKPSAASKHLMKHRGQAIVFENIEELHEKIDDENLPVHESNVMVLKNCGPKGYPGMAEVGNMPLPRKMLKQGVTDMVRISDGRMSGTAYGTCVLHISPEAAVGGNLALVKNGDWIQIDVEKRTLHLEVSDAELLKRRAQWTPPDLNITRGYQKLYLDHVTQADEGADLDFLSGKSGAAIPRENH
jgi:dihydroxy-acid dehydratase